MENSKLIKATRVPKVTSRNPDTQLGLTGVGSIKNMCASQIHGKGLRQGVETRVTSWRAEPRSPMQFKSKRLFKSI